MTLQITFHDQIPSGKNQVEEHWRQGKKVKHGNDRFAAWRQAAGMEFILQKAKWTPLQKMALPMLGDLVVTISYRPLDKTRRDLPGMLDALWHFLEHMEIIENDGQIKGVTWIYPWRTEGPCLDLRIDQVG